MHSLKPIVILATKGEIPYILINEIRAHFDNVHIIFEQPETKKTIIKRRAKSLGWLTAISQIGTMIISKIGKRCTYKRSADIITSYGVSNQRPDDANICNVTSINSQECYTIINELQPAVIFTIACRIISKATLQNISCPILNFHAGINPTYRGQMGAYWALAENDNSNFGATVHLVDSGIDTGATLYEKRIKPSHNDNISTYPLLLTAASTEIVISAIEDALSGSMSPKPPMTNRSVLRYPPTIWAWLWHGIRQKVW